MKLAAGAARCRIPRDFSANDVQYVSTLRGSIKAKTETLSMTFLPGQSGNPAGRAAGSRNKKTLAAEAALFDHAQELVDDLVDRARRGEPAADDELPDRHPDEYRSTQDPLYRCGEERSPGAAQHEAERSDALQTCPGRRPGDRGPVATDADVDPGSAPHHFASLRAAAHPGNDGLQIVADSDAGGQTAAGAG